MDVIADLEDGSIDSLCSSLETYIEDHFMEHGPWAISSFNEAAFQVCVYMWLQHRLPEDWKIDFEKTSDSNRRRADILIETSEAKIIMLELKYANIETIQYKGKSKDQNIWKTCRKSKKHIETAEDPLQIIYTPYQASRKKSVYEHCVEKELPKLEDTGAEFDADFSFIIVAVAHRVIPVYPELLD